MLPTLPQGQQLLPHGTPHCAVDKVPPEDDEFSEYSEYSVEEYQDPEVPWDGDGENEGSAQRGSGKGRLNHDLLASH